MQTEVRASVLLRLHGLLTAALAVVSAAAIRQQQLPDQAHNRLLIVSVGASAAARAPWITRPPAAGTNLDLELWGLRLRLRARQSPSKA